MIIPARNEEQRLARCLIAIDLAISELQLSGGPACDVRVVLVLDSCTDQSQLVAADFPWVEVISCRAGNVGAARAIGARRALQASTGRAPADWLACTDADSVVPADWLITQAAHATTGTDLLLGLVRPDPDELAPEVFRRWAVAQSLTDGHPHIHGANMGVRASSYLLAGGFPAIAVHEDVHLSSRVRSLGGTVVSTASSQVLTSARLDGRAPAGLAEYLAGLVSHDGVPSAEFPAATSISKTRSGA